MCLGVLQGSMAYSLGGQALQPAGQPFYTSSSVNWILPPRAAVAVKRDNTYKALGTVSGTYEVLGKQPLVLAHSSCFPYDPIMLMNLRTSLSSSVETTVGI